MQQGRYPAFRHDSVLSTIPRLSRQQSRSDHRRGMEDRLDPSAAVRMAMLNDKGRTSPFQSQSALHFGTTHRFGPEDMLRRDACFVKATMDELLSTLGSLAKISWPSGSEICL